MSKAEFKYRAFLSYSHRDARTANWLHRSLERFPVEKSWIGQPTALGPVPDSLHPIFRDRNDFSAGQTLSEQTKNAIQDSLFLIVLCSPNAAKSAYIAEEISLFKTFRQAEHIIPVIIDGDPSAPQSNPFPAGLQDQNSLSFDVLAADLRKMADGPDLAVAKISARLLGLSTDAVYRRAERYRRQRDRLRNGIIASLLVLSIAAITSAVAAYRQSVRTVNLANATLSHSTSLVKTAVENGVRHGVPNTQTLAFLNQASGIFETMRAHDVTTPKLHHAKAMMLIEFARQYETLKQTGQQISRAREAVALLDQLPPRTHKTLADDLAKARAELIDALIETAALDTKALDDAERLNEQMISALRQRIKKSPDSQKLKLWLAISLQRSGEMLQNQGKITATLKRFRAAADVAASMVETQKGTSPALAKKGQMLRISLFQSIAKTQQEAGHLKPAGAAYLAAQRLFGGLVAQNPGDIRLERGQAINRLRWAGVLRAEGKLKQALAHCRDALDIITPLRKKIPGSIRLKMDQANIYALMGSILRHLGEWTTAQSTLAKGLTLRQTLKKARPKHPVIQKTLAIALTQSGHLLADRGELLSARAAFKSAIQMRQGLLRKSTQAGRLDILNSLSFTQRSLANAEFLGGSEGQAQKQLILAVARSKYVYRHEPDNPRYAYVLATTHGDLADILIAVGQADAALQNLTAAKTVLDRLLLKIPKHKKWRRTLAVVQRRLGEAYTALDQPDLAQRNFRAALKTLGQLTVSTPDQLEYKAEYAVALGTQAEALKTTDLRAPGNSGLAQANCTAENCQEIRPASITGPRKRATAILTHLKRQNRLPHKYQRYLTLFAPPRAADQ